MDIRIVLSIAATSLAVIGYIPYIRDIHRGKTKPHAFSWFVWGILAYIAGTAQILGGGGLGSIVAFTTGTISFGIAAYSYRKDTVEITRGDRVSLAATLCAIPLWLLTRNPVASVILISIIDVVAFWPTIRKSYHMPHSETLSQQWIAVIKHALSTGAQQQYTPVTMLYPVSLGLSSLFFAVMLMMRRRQIVEQVVR